MNSPVQKIKERLGIEEVISSYIKLEKAGVNFKARCPFHNEKTASFFVSSERESYYCFGCGAKGDIFTFVEEFEGLDFKGALKLLAERAGVPLSEFKREDSSSVSEKEKLYEIMEEATLYFQANKNNEVLEYLKKRGLNEKTIKEWRIGFALPEWRGLHATLGGKFKDDELEKAGLIKKSEKSASAGVVNYYDRFRGRIMFPICDSSGRVIAFSGRIFPPNDEEAKYLNSPETLIFRKSTVLYGIDKAKDSIRKNDFSIVVEGQFDLLMSYQAGFKNTVATLGTAMSDLSLLARLSNNIVFVFDSDKAGFSASMRGATTALSLDMNVKAADTGEGKDPADLILEKGSEGWRKSIREAKHVIEFLFDKFKTKSSDALTIKLEMEKKILPYLHYITNPVKKSHFISIISHKTGMREEDIRESLKNSIPKDEDYENRAENMHQKNELPKNLIRKDYILRRIIGIILWQENAKKRTIEPKKIISEISRILNISEDELINKFKEDAHDLIFEAEVFYSKDINISNDVAEMISHLEEEHLKTQIPLKMRELEEAEILKKNNPRSAEILKEIGEINEKIQNIKSGRLNK